MEKDTYILLIYKQLDNDISETELKQLNSWLAESPDNQDLADDLAKAYDVSENYMEVEAAAIDVDAAFAEQLELIEEETPENVVSIDKNKRKRNRLFGIVSAAVAAVVLLIIGVQFNNLPPQDVVLATTDKIEIVTLPDGSKVTVYPNSQITYKDEFTERRYVRLESGKAKFDVVKERGQFSVSALISDTYVLGTRFIIETQEDTDKLIVEEGTVQFENRSATEEFYKKTIAEAGDVVVLTSTSLEKTSQQENVNFFEFQNADLKTISKRLESHFDTSISINPNIENCRLTVTFDGQKIEEILMIIDELLDSEHRKIGEKFEIVGESCE